MEWLLILMFNGPHGTVSTERFVSLAECTKVGEVVVKEVTTPLLKYATFKCVEVRKLNN